jgi:hypothetical protein
VTGHRVAALAASLAVTAGAASVGLLVSPSGAAAGSGDSLSPASTHLTIQRAGLEAAVIVNGTDDEALECQLSFDASTPADGLTFVLHGRPKVSACDNGQGAQADATVTTHGTWAMSAVPKSSSTNMNHVVFAIPKGGMVFTYGALPGCKVTVGGVDLVGNLQPGATGVIDFFNKPHVTSTGCKTKGWMQFGGEATFSPSVSIVQGSPGSAAAPDGTWSQAATLVANNSCGTGKITIAGTLTVTITPQSSGTGVEVTTAFTDSPKPKVGWHNIHTASRMGFKAAATTYDRVPLDGSWREYVNGTPDKDGVHVKFDLTVTAPDTLTPTAVTHKLVATQCF